MGRLKSVRQLGYWGYIYWLGVWLIQHEYIGQGLVYIDSLQKELLAREFGVWLAGLYVGAYTDVDVLKYLLDGADTGLFCLTIQRVYGDAIGRGVWLKVLKPWYLVSPISTEDGGGVCWVDQVARVIAYYEHGTGEVFKLPKAVRQRLGHGD